MSASYNRVVLVGNLTRDPEVRYIPSGSAVAEIGLAVNRSWYDKASNERKEETTFVDVTLWGRTAEVAGEYLSKGRSILIEGYLKTDSWDDKETGKKRSKLKVVGEVLQMLGGGKDGGGGGGGGGSRGGQSRSQASNQSAAAQNYDNGPSDGGGGGFSDEVPF
jgi:single-strand DNA-binding protein